MLFHLLYVFWFNAMSAFQPDIEMERFAFSEKLLLFDLQTTSNRDKIVFILLNTCVNVFCLFLI